MKRNFIIGVIAVVAIIIFFLFSGHEKSFGEFEVKEYEIENKSHRLLVADTPAKWEKGLMFYRKLNGATGMIFEFPDTTTRTFWNKNTFMDLDIYWMNGDTVVGKDFLPSIESSREIVTVSSPEPANRVIEFVR